MNFKKIDMDNWDRAEIYNWHINYVRWKINMTMQLDVTKLVNTIKENKFRCYPVFTYITSKYYVESYKSA